MPHYRIYSLDSANRIVDVAEGEFADDASAISRARTLLASRPGVEIWQLERPVGRLLRPDREAQGQEAVIQPVLAQSSAGLRHAPAAPTPA